MWYAILEVSENETLKARFYSRADRDRFVDDHPGKARPVRSKQAKFVPGADRCVTFSGRRDDGTWLPL